MFEIGTAVIIASAFNLSIRLVVHEDQHSKLVHELFRSDMDKLESLLGLTHSHHREVGEGVHHRHALARLHASIWWQKE